MSLLEGTPRRQREQLVVLPGMLGDPRSWEAVASRLADLADPHYTRIDLDPSVTAIAERVLADAPDSFSLAGHSLGGIVAMHVARIAPGRVTRLALLNTSARPPSPVQLRAWAEQARRVDGGDFRAVVSEYARASLPRGASPSLVEALERGAEGVGPAGFRRQLRAQAARPDCRPSLPQVTVPVLVVSGEVDEVCPPPLQSEIAALIPGSEHRFVEGAGHMSLVERPGDVAALLRGWLARDPLPHTKENQT